MRSSRLDLARCFCRRLVLVGAVYIALPTFRLAAAEPDAAGARPTIKATVQFEPTAEETAVPKRFQLEKHSFDYAMTPSSVAALATDSTPYQVWEVTFPSPVQTPHELNNTVHCEYFQPQLKRGEKGKSPGVIVLHILGGDFALSRLFCRALAQRGVAALFLKMPYYGPRRDPQVNRRMISPNPNETVEGMTQAILDIRRGTAFLASREEVNAEKLGVFGISLGGITGALATSIEPRIQQACLLLAGADLGRVAFDAPELKKIRAAWFAQGKTKEDFLAIMREIDPVTYADRARGKRILMLNAKTDEIIPKACTESLWEAFGKPEIHWYDGGHYSVAWHLLDALDRVADFFEKQ